MDRRYALVLEGTNQLRVEESPPGRAEIGDGDALVETMFVAICGTDLEVIDGTSDRARPPVILGHEWAGRVAGRFVVGENVVGPGCEIGFELPGGFASHFTMPARNLHLLPADLEGPSACLIEPLAVSVRACRQAHLQASDSVLVFGDGVIGMFIARIASLTAADVTLVGRHQDRLDVGARLGVPAVRLESDMATRHEGWNVVFEASGRSSGLSAALAAAAAGARVLIAGDYGKAPIPFDATAVVHKELHLAGSNASGGAWDEAVRLASTRAVDLNLVPLLVMPFDDWPEALDAARQRRAPRVLLRHRAADAQ